MTKELAESVKRLREVTEPECEYTGRKIYVSITHIIRGSEMDILSIEPQDTMSRCEIRVIDRALANAAEILANFKGEPENTKLEQWQACYAKLFTQMNELVQSTKPVLKVDVCPNCLMDLSEPRSCCPKPKGQPDDCRAAFEKWAKTFHHDLTISTKHGGYEDRETWLAWRAFQGAWKPERESGEREAYHAMHVNFLRHGGSEEGRAMFEKYLRYRAAGHSHERADELCTKPYNEVNQIEGGK